MNEHFPYLLILMILALPVTAAAEDVVWMNAVNVSVSGGSLTKTNSGSTWSAGASGANVIRDGYWSTVGLEAAATAGAAGAVSRGSKMLRKLPDIVRDATGKVHKKLPAIKDLKNKSVDYLKEAMEELRRSIQRRKAEQRQLGEDGPHRRRIGQEESLLKQIGKRVEDIVGAKNK